MLTDAEAKLADFESKEFFTPFELEHILQIPLSDIVEIFSKVPKVANPAGCFKGDESRDMIRKWARKRVYADIIARNAVNAAPEIRRAEDDGEPLQIKLRDVSHGEDFSVRFPGDLKRYLDSLSSG